MKYKICPFCRKKAKIKTILDPYKSSKDKERLKLYDYSCGTKGCYLEEGAGQYCTVKELDSMWKDIKEGSTKTLTHYSPKNSKATIPCSSRSVAADWTDDKSKVSCSRCLIQIGRMVKSNSLAQTG